MPDIVQHLLVLLIVLASVSVVGWQIARTFRGRKGAGNCCAKGCEGSSQASERKSSERIVFLPAEMLGRKR